MIINGITISENKYKELSSILPKEVLNDLYTCKGYSNTEISKMFCVSQSWISKLRKIYSIQTDVNYRLRRNKKRFEKLNSEQKQFLYGSLFGDSCIAIQKSGQGYYLCRHCMQQKDYLMKISEIMKNFVSKVYTGWRKCNGKDFEYIDVRTYTHPEFTKLRQEFYPNGKKDLNEKLFRKLTGKSFAYWFFDDGSTTGYGFSITTFDKNFKDTEKFKKLFKQVLNLNVSIRFRGNEGTIRILKDSHDVAWSYIKPVMVDSMWHKIPKKYRQDNQQPSLERNLFEGSTTGGNLNTNIVHDDKTRSL